jgi:hypothetical protein
MDEITQQNAALVEQAAAAAESLQEQASKLSELVGYFTLVRSGQMAQSAGRDLKALPTQIKSNKAMTARVAA